MTETDRTAVFKILSLFRILERFLQVYKIPKEVASIFVFFNRNMTHLEADESLWDDIRITKENDIEHITDMMAEIVWMIMDLSREINTTRHIYGRKKVNFVDAAIERDKEKKASQSKGSETDPAGKDPQVSSGSF